MDAATLMGLVSTGLNAAVVASLGSNPSWRVSEDWGLPGWRVVRVPAGVKFQHLERGLVCEEVLVTRAGEEERASLERLAAVARIPMHLVLLERLDQPHNRLAKPFLHPWVGSDQ